MTQPRFRALCRLCLLAPILALSACGVAGTSGSPGSGDLAHATGATDLILRSDSEGGFVAPGFLATEAPTFSLYGDGTAIFRDPQDAAPLPQSSADPIIRGVPFQIAHLTEVQVQALLAFALDAGGLRTAADHYDRPIADAPTSVLTIDAGGIHKAVSVNGLGIDAATGADGAILTKLAALAARLQGFASEVPDEAPWTPDRYRGILSEDAFTSPVPWPWPTIAPAEFVQRAGSNAPPFPIRTMTPAEVARLGVAGFEGGLQGVSLKASSGKVYSFRLRPLLPDEPF